MGETIIANEIKILMNFLETFTNTIKKLIKIKKRNKSTITISPEILETLKKKGTSFNDSLLYKEFDNDLVIFVGISVLGKNFEDLEIIHYDNDDNRPDIGFITYHIQFGIDIQDKKYKNQLLKEHYKIQYIIFT